jgi:hypothetical protein
MKAKLTREQKIQILDEAIAEINLFITGYESEFFYSNCGICCLLTDLTQRLLGSVYIDVELKKLFPMWKAFLWAKRSYKSDEEVKNGRYDWYWFPRFDEAEKYAYHRIKVLNYMKTLIF